MPAGSGDARMNRALFAFLAALPAVVAAGQSPGPEAADPRRPIRSSASELRDTVERYVEDREALLRRYSLEGSTERRLRMRRFHEEWLARVEALDYESTSLEGRLD